MVDRSLWPQMGRFDPRGVRPQLVWNVRNALDAAGYAAVRIVASGGFTAEKIRAFETAGVPVDSAAVSSRFPGVIAELQLSRDGCQSPKIAVGRLFRAWLE